GPCRRRRCGCCKVKCVDALRQVSALVDFKAPDAAAFKGWLRQISASAPGKTPQPARLSGGDGEARHHHAFEKQLPFLRCETRFVSHRRYSILTLRIQPPTLASAVDGLAKVTRSGSPAWP